MTSPWHDRRWPVSCTPLSPCSGILLSRDGVSWLSGDVRSRAGGAAIAIQTDDRRRSETFTAEQRDHWAYQPVKRAEPPAVKESAWVKNPIDRFILAEIEKLGLPHSAPRPIAWP